MPLSDPQRFRGLGGLPLVALAAGLVLGGALVRSDERNRLQTARERAGVLASGAGHGLQTHADRTFVGMRVLASTAGRGASRVDIEAVVHDLERGARAARFVVVSGERVRLGERGGTLVDPAVDPGIRRAAATDSLVIVGPVEEPDGPQMIALLGAGRVENEDAPRDVILARMPVADLLDAAQLQSLAEHDHDFRLELVTSPDEVHVLAPPVEASLPAPVRIRIPFGPRSLFLSVAPQAGWTNPWRLALEWVGVALGSVLLALGVRQIVREARVLRRDLERRRRHLSAAHQRIEQEAMARRRAEAERERSDRVDQLTGLSNRAHLSQKIEEALDELRADPDARFALLFLDLDRFRYVNHSFGSAAGDDLLEEVARRLEKNARPSDELGRVGGDEFAILARGIQDREAASLLADRVRRCFREPFHVGDREVHANISIGIVLGDNPAQGPRELLRDGHTAVSRVRTGMSASHIVFDASMHEHAAAAQSLEADLRRALEQGDFKLHLQPIVRLRDGRRVGAEVLLRWDRPKHGSVAPIDFLPIAEETGLIVRMDQWVLTRAAEILEDWQSRYPRRPPLSFSVNLSGHSLARDEVVDRVAHLLSQGNLAPGSFKLEITESALVENVDAAVTTLQKLRDLGAVLMLDDFGTGYSSLSYLHRFPFHIVKIDRAFVCGVDTSKRNERIVRTIVSLAHSLGMEVVAEGLQTVEERRRVADLGAEYGQGFLYAKALPPDDFLKWLGAEGPGASGLKTTPAGSARSGSASAGTPGTARG